MEKVQKEMEKQYGKYKLSHMQEYAFYNALGEDGLGINEWGSSHRMDIW